MTTGLAIDFPKLMGNEPPPQPVMGTRPVARTAPGTCQTNEAMISFTACTARATGTASVRETDNERGS